MLSIKYQRYVDRLNELVIDGKAIAELEKRSSQGIRFIQGEDKIRLHGWLANLRNIIELVFGRQSPQFRHLEELIPKDGVKNIQVASQVYELVGLLQGSLTDLENGYLLGQEFLIAGEVFDSILEQAKNQFKNGNKDIAAMLARIVLEDSLKRMARSDNIDDNQKSSVINDNLKKIGKYPQAQWRSIQLWLDIGNAASHGKFDDYIKEDVINMIAGIERFLASDFRK